MDEHRKNAYRYLLGWAMLEIRTIAWWSIRWRSIWNPLYWRAELRRIRYLGTLADWLHNLALYSPMDFDQFNEEWFWQDLERIEKRYPEFMPSHYRAIFDGRLNVPPNSGWEAITQ